MGVGSCGSRWSATEASRCASTCTASRRSCIGSCAPRGWRTTRRRRRPRASTGACSPMRRRATGIEHEVVIDVVGGTSAGGINGIYLAKALAHNLPQDVLRDLWLDRGNITKLARLPTWIPLAVRAPVLLAQLKRKPPLRGREMSVWLYDALRSMDDSGPAPAAVPTLMPDGHVLQLFVTMTDLHGYDRHVVLSDPKVAPDRSHRHVFEFRHGDGDDLFTRDHNLALTFAARATSCFPGAFPPISTELLKSYLPKAPGEVQKRFFRIYELSGAVVRAPLLRRRRRARQPALRTRRRRDPREARGRRGRSPAAVHRARSRPADASGQERCANRRRSRRCWRPSPASRAASRSSTSCSSSTGCRSARAACRTSSSPASATSPTASRASPASRWRSSRRPFRRRSSEWQRLLNAEAQRDAGATYTTYLRSKISGVVDALAATVCRSCDYPAASNHAFLVRAALRCWAEESSLFAKSPDPTTAQIEFLRDFDLDYGIRRLQFVVAGVNWWYACVDEPGYPVREQLDALKARLWRAIDELRAAQSGREFPDSLAAEVAACFPADEVSSYVRDHGFDGAGYVQRKRNELTQVVGVAEGVSDGRARGLLARALSRRRRRDGGVGAVAPPRPARALPRLPALGCPDPSGPIGQRRRRARCGRGRPHEPARLQAADAAGRHPTEAQGHRDRPLRRLLQAPLPRERLPLGPPRRRRARSSGSCSASRTPTTARGVRRHSTRSSPRRSRCSARPRS